ncbi:MAG: thiamine-phosphate kinase [Solirubrobacterales bacterium]
MSPRIELGAGGEFELIDQIRERLGSASPGSSTRAPGRAGSSIAIPSGDDAAVTVPAGATATAVDSLVDGVHFERATASYESIGHKALAAALSDLAAMGAAPGEAYIALGMPPDVDAGDVLKIADGVAALAAATGTRVLGGDLTRSATLFVSVTVVGHARAPELLVSRAGARDGSALVVTGELGGAAAGRLLIEQPELARGLDAQVGEALRARQLRPRALLEAGAALATAGAEAMIDVSDGLGADAGHLAAAGGVQLSVDLELVPLQAGVAAVADAAGLDPLDLAVGGGEDYELLAVLPGEAVAAARAALEGMGIALSEIGAVGPGGGVRLLDAEGKTRSPAGFDHLSS